MAEVLQMPAYGPDTQAQSQEQEESYRQQFDRNRLQDRIEARQQASAKATAGAGSIAAIKQETDATIKLIRLVTALSLIGTIVWILETNLRYVTANIMGFEWPGIWQKVTKVERWVMFGANGIALVAFVIILTLLVLFDPSVQLQLAIAVVTDIFKDLGCQIFSCSK